ncbi:putative lipid-transfer protein DIR1 [Oryza brachyantha]|uniref:Bifunctional inhibitor/plant lipid transfer protein/seed storage helical domain-containing protein n=1 Tax=Oryza brachyantha TaxID=4533 RepID=J3MK24_ORYBR|nr:putative lipid-transfer protein DIR1 [Oryza brachyantha]
MAKVAAAALAVLLVVAAAPAAQAAVCNMSNDQFMACQPAAAATSNPTPSPSADCCTALSKADLSCLCSYKNSPWLSLYNIDPSRAMQLPAKCGLTAPPNC